MNVRVVFHRDTNSFVFDHTSAEVSPGSRPSVRYNLFNDIRQRIVDDDVFRPYQAHVFNVDDSAFISTNERGSHTCEMSGGCVQLTFNCAEAAMAFKLAYVGDDVYLPWRSL